ncbi:hypothetical protein, partial [Streptomyces mirabilis]|uniref:hypothetical protein n=1 Tax=Streptomyces mirabilis TaxID=68239 RepID=UPI00367CACAC
LPWLTVADPCNASTMETMSSLRTRSGLRPLTLLPPDVTAGSDGANLRNAALQGSVDRLFVAHAGGEKKKCEAVV